MKWSCRTSRYVSCNLGKLPTVLSDFINVHFQGGMWTMGWLVVVSGIGEDPGHVDARHTVGAKWVVIHELTRVITWLGASISVQILMCVDHVLQVVTTSSTWRRSLTAKPSSASTSASRSASERVTSSVQSSCTRVIQQPLALRRTCQPKTYLSSFSGIVMIIR